MNIKGFYKKPNNEPKKDTSMAEAMMGTAQLFENLKKTKEDVIKTTDDKISEVNDVIKEAKDTVTESAKKIDDNFNILQEAGSRIKSYG